MPLIDTIPRSLAPGIALTSVIFYNTSLQHRFTYITGRVRELNREARELGAEHPERHAARLVSIRRQVDMLSRRSLKIRQSVLTVYVSFMCFIVCILSLLTLRVADLAHADVVPIVPFAGGFVALAFAAVRSFSEMSLSHQTVLEDVRSSFGGSG
jgi:hypothetical protein